MNKLEELNDIAQGVADVTTELMYDSIDWQISDFPLDGDDYNAIREDVMFLAVEKMYMEIKRKYYVQE